MRRLGTTTDILLLLTVAIWSLNVSVTRYVLTHGFQPLAYAAVRYAAAAPRRRRRPLARADTRRARPQRDHSHRPGRDLPLPEPALLRLLPEAGDLASTVSLILGTTPIFAAVLAWIVGLERLDGRFWLAAAASSAGVAMVALGSGGKLSADLGGDLLALGLSGTWAAYSVCIAPLMRALLEGTPATQCDTCPPSAIAVADSETAATVVTVASTVVVIAVLGLIVAILIGRWRKASVTSRRTLRPVYLSCGVSVVLLLVSVAADCCRASPTRSSGRCSCSRSRSFPSRFSPVCSAAGSIGRRPQDCLVSLDAGIPLRDALAQALHDPSLEIVYWLETQGVGGRARSRGGRARQAAGAVGDHDRARRAADRCPRPRSIARRRAGARGVDRRPVRACRSRTCGSRRISARSTSSSKTVADTRRRACSS